MGIKEELGIKVIVNAMTVGCYSTPFATSKPKSVIASGFAKPKLVVTLGYQRPLLTLPIEISILFLAMHVLPLLFKKKALLKKVLK